MIIQNNIFLLLIYIKLIAKSLQTFTYFFVIGGAWFALISTLNSQLASATKPLMQACEDGWLPRSMAKLSKYKTPTTLLTIFFIVGLVPIVTGLDIGILGKITTTVGAVNNSMIALSLLGISRVLPEAWDKSPLHINDGKRKALVVAAVATFIFQAVLLGSSLSLPLLLGNVAVVVAAFIFANVRYASGKVKMEVSYEAD